MIKKISFIGLIAFSSVSYAQIYIPGSSVAGSSGNNNIGIGIPSPQARLHVDNDGSSGLLQLDVIEPHFQAWDPESQSYTPPPVYAFKVYVSDNKGARTSFLIDRTGQTFVGNFSGITGSQNLNVKSHLGVYGNSTSNFLKLDYNTAPLITWTTTQNLGIYANSGNPIYVSPNGQLGIGTNNFVGSYKLYVKGKAVFEETVVKLESNWPDYVFAPGYQLMDLDELQSFIALNGRLPGTPSAKEVKENGLAVGQTEVLLMEKVEELTLYLLELKSELEATQAELAELKQKVQ